jgi:hypothetical protein
MKIDAAVRRAAADTAQLAAVFGSGNAADEIIAAACTRHERLVIQRIIDSLQLAALANTVGTDEHSAATLVWFATTLDNQLGPDGGRSPYTPQDGDVVQVTLTGVITEYAVGAGAGKLWELDSAEGILIPLSEEDFETLGVIKLA